MNETQSQPDAGSQEAGTTPVAQKLGLLDQQSLSDLLKSGFLDEKEAAPATQEKAEPEVEAEEPIVDSEAEPEVEADQPIEEEAEAEESSLSKGVQKRINKLVAAKKAAQAELEAQKSRLSELQRELETAKSSAPAKQVDVSDAVERLSTIEQVKEERQRALDVILWCEENPDGGVITLPDGTEKDLTDQEVRSMKRLAIRRKEIELPAREEYLQQQTYVEGEVVKDFPWWSKPETEEYQTAQQILREFPELKKRRADWKHVAGLLVMGIKAYGEKKAQKKPTAPIRRAPAQPSIKAAPARTTQTDLQKAKQSFIRNNSRDGMTDVIKAMGLV
jgi:hypothetical protein